MINHVATTLKLKLGKFSLFDNFFSILAKFENLDNFSLFKFPDLESFRLFVNFLVFDNFSYFPINSLQFSLLLISLLINIYYQQALEMIQFFLAFI